MKRLFLAVAALAALVSCNRGNELVPSQNFRNVSIVAKSAETKTVLDGNAVKWEANDEIKVRFDKTDPSASHFETFTTAQGGETATFAGTLPNDVSETGGYNATGYAVYPATAMAADGTVSFTLPSNVTVDASGTFSASENLSSAKVSLTDLVSDGTTSANFLNAFSIIRFKLDSDVQTLKLTADAPLVGTATMVFDNEGRLVKSGDFTTPSNVLNITAPTGGFDGTTAYNILVFPGSFNTLTAEMTDKDGCTYRKENNGTYDFAAAKFYNFNFTDPSKFDREYSFTGKGRVFAEGDKIQTVFDDVASEVLTADADGKFTGHTTHGEYEANKTGYAIYPSTSYTESGISYTLPANGTTDIADLWSASVSLKATEATFASVTSSLAKLSFTVPTGVKSVNITSDKGIVGTASMTVTDGVLVAGAGDGNTITVTEEKTYTLYVYPVESANLTVTLTDAADETVEKTMTLTVAAGATQNLDLSGDLNFDKNGNFTHEGFENGNGNEGAIEF